MSLIFNGTTVKKITYNGNEVKKLIYNNVDVYSASKPIGIKLVTAGYSGSGKIREWGLIDEIGNTLVL